MLTKLRTTAPGGVFTAFAFQETGAMPEREVWMKIIPQWLELPEEFEQTTRVEDRNCGGLLSRLPLAVYHASQQRSRTAMKVDEVATALQDVVYDYVARSLYTALPLHFREDETRQLVLAGISSEAALERLLWMYTDPLLNVEKPLAERWSTDMLHRTILYVEYSNSHQPALDCSFAYIVFVLPTPPQEPRRLLCCDLDKHTTSTVRAWLGS